MKLIVEFSPETEFNKDADAPRVPTDPYQVADEFLEWLHAAASVLPQPEWLGSFNDVTLSDR